MRSPAARPAAVSAEARYKLWKRATRACELTGAPDDENSWAAMLDRGRLALSSSSTVAPAAVAATTASSPAARPARR